MDILLSSINYRETSLSKGYLTANRKILGKLEIDRIIMTYIEAIIS